MGAAGGGQTAALIAAMMGSSLLGGLTAPQGQKMKSFQGQGGNDPGVMLAENKGLMEDYLNSLIDSANSPVTIKTTANPLPSFKGGALPMAIAAPGMDANRLNPELRTRQPNVTIPKRRLSGGMNPSGPGGSGYQPVAGMPNPNDVVNGAPPVPPFVGEGPDPNDPAAASAAIDLLLNSSARRTF